MSIIASVLFLVAVCSNLIFVVKYGELLGSERIICRKAAIGTLIGSVLQGITIGSYLMFGKTAPTAIVLLLLLLASALILKKQKKATNEC